MQHLSDWISFLTVNNLKGGTLVLLFYSWRVFLHLSRMERSAWKHSTRNSRLLKLYQTINTFLHGADWFSDLDSIRIFNKIKAFETGSVRHVWFPHSPPPSEDVGSLWESAATVGWAEPFWVGVSEASGSVTSSLGIAVSVCSAASCRFGS